MEKAGTKKIYAERIKIEPLTDPKTFVSGLTVTLTADTRKGQIGANRVTPIAIRISWNGKTNYLQTGHKVSSITEYEKLKKSKSTNKKKGELIDIYENVKNIIHSIYLEGKPYSFDEVKERITHKKASASMLFEYWSGLAESKEKVKTKQAYLQALSKFKKFHSKDIPLASVSQADAKAWCKWMLNNGCSNDTAAIYLRSLRAVLNNALNTGKIKNAPKIEMPGDLNRREENYIHIEDVLKLWNYWQSLTDEKKRTGSGWAVGMWLLEYCINGANSVDVLNLKWSSEYKSNYPEFKFERSKINRVTNKPKKKIVVYVPIIEQLQDLLNVYASEYKEGALVFPNYIGDSDKPEQIASKVHDFNKRIRRLISPVCDELGIKRVTAQYCRNSFITALSMHGVSDLYIDRAVAHIGNNPLLRGYQGNFTDKQRRKFNQKLFIVPKDEE